MARSGRRFQRHVRNRRNTGQGLTAKTQGVNAEQVAHGRDFASRMTLERRWHIFSLDTSPVVCHFHQLQAGVLDVNVNLRGPGVNTVFNQFLNDRRRPLDDLPGGNLVAQVFW